MESILSNQYGFTFHLVSDIHLELMKTPYKNIFSDIKSEFIADVLFLAGDIGHPLRYQDALKSWLKEVSQHFKAVIYVPGNHDYYQKASGKHALSITEVNKALIQYKAEISNLYVLNPGVIEIGNRVVIGATLWTYVPKHAEDMVSEIMNDYRMIYTISPSKIKSGSNDKNKSISNLKDFDNGLLSIPSTSYQKVRRKKQGLLTVKNTVEMHETDLFFVTEQLKRASVLNKTALLCTHHPPMLLNVSSDSNQSPLNNPVMHAYGTDLLYLFRDYGQAENSTLEWALHGHTHFNHLTACHGTKVYSNARGYHGKHTGSPFNINEIKLFS